MKTCIVLMRGINVGGKNRLPMKNLVTILENLGARNVRTYIQSGNAVFQGLPGSPKPFAEKLTAQIKKQHGFEPGVLILTLDAVETAIANNPFPEAETAPATLHLGFLSSPPRAPDLKPHWAVHLLRQQERPDQRAHHSAWSRRNLDTSQGEL